MKNQFFYKAVVPSMEKDEDDNPKTEEVLSSFNMDLVNRTVEYEPNKLMVMLQDYHNEFQTVSIPKFNGKGQFAGGYKMEYKEVTVHSKIYLNEEDSKRYRELTEVNWAEKAPLIPQ